MSFQIMSDLYNKLFYKQISNPELNVDYCIWNQIVASLPPDYTLPDPKIIQALEQK